MNETGHDIVFYDGGCGLCHRAVTFLIARDRSGERFRYAPIGGSTFEERLLDEQRSRLPDSIVVLTRAGDLIVRSQAVRHLLVRLRGGWALLGRAFAIVPTRLADAAYDFVASIRRKLFARPASACPVLPPELRARFLP